MRKTKLINLKIINWLLVVLWAIVIFTFSSIGQIKVAEFFFWDFILKKSAHITEYAILFILIFRATGKNYALTFILTLLYAVSDEFHQSFVPGRTTSFLDIGYDSVGAFIGAYLLWKFNLVRQ